MTRLLLALCLAWPLGAQLTDAEQEDFLRTARVIRTEEISVGSTRPLRATLQRGDVTHDAHIQRVDERAPARQLVSGLQIGFRDYWGYNIVAYRLDRLLGLGMAPVSVQRDFDGRAAAYTWWIDNVEMLERERWEKGIEPPDRQDWNDQMYRVRVFNQLAYNTDSNLTNVLIDRDWKIWLIDYTRAFRIQTNLISAEGLVRIDRALLNRLRALNADTIEETVGEWLDRREREALLRRRDKIVELFERKIAEQGEAAVLYD